jgi:hypothetical protein
LAVATAVSIAGGSTATTTLVVTDTEGTELLAVPVEEGDTVAIEYTHSVERTLVTDRYVVSRGSLIDDQMLFSSFGAGLPAQADVRRSGGRYVYEPPARRHDPLVVTTGSVADHDLLVDDRAYDLHELAEGETVELRIRP